MGNENGFELAGGSSYSDIEGSSYRESTVVYIIDRGNTFSDRILARNVACLVVKCIDEQYKQN